MSPRRGATAMRLGRLGVAGLLFVSGMCALTYQVAWLRLLRLIFGASTASSAAVLAIFMGGLGLGGIFFGRRADRTPRPMLLYAKLEAGAAVAAALSPLLILVVHRLYISLGGSTDLGLVAGTGVRMVLAIVALGGATFLMGGTLPAAARAITSRADVHRRGVAWLYGANTLGAVVGALATTFFAVELLGVRATVLAAAGLNALIAGLAAWAARHEQQAPERPSAASPTQADRATPTAFVAVAAAMVGFVFLVMELVWYRMLAPLLGGSSYSFGLILAVGLAGIGLGGLAYAVLATNRQPTLLIFAATCGLEALLIAVPFALGDRLAILAMLLRPVGDASFWLLVAAWAAITALVVLPASVVAGFQFPVLVALLGKGRRDLGNDLGTAYAWNTVGAIIGSLAGGFVLIPRLGALGAWRMMVVLLVLLAGVAAVLALRDWIGGPRLLLPAALPAVAAVWLLFATGPTAVWRHTPIGAGAMPASFEGANDIRNMMQAVRRSIDWQADGRESSVAIHALDDLSFLINGKADGSAVKDAPTQIMSGLIGAALHPNPKRALVIGLGTGSSAGWLADVASIEQVDVYELEPAVLEMARRCAAVNRNVLENPKVNLEIGDGRELLLTTDTRYDVVFSEPSNPYRAGVTSLFTREFYRAARQRLANDGIFLQWLQGYGVDSQVVRTVLATLRAEFGAVESWQVHHNDLLLIASARRITHDLGRLHARLEQEPFRSALEHTVGVDGIEGFYAGFVAGPGLATAVLAAEGERLNTDDHPIIEFGFARGLGRDLGFSISRLARLAASRGDATPRVHGGSIAPLALADAISARNTRWEAPTPFAPTGDPGFDFRAEARNTYLRGELVAAARLWQRQEQPPHHPIDRIWLAEALAADGTDAPFEPDRFTIHAANARRSLVTGDHESASRSLAAAFAVARTDPWVFRPVLERALLLAARIGRDMPSTSERLFQALGEPFAVSQFDDLRLRIRLELAEVTDFAGRCGIALEPLEPHVPWEESLLTLRLRCYQTIDDPRLPAAQRDFESFLTHSPPKLAP